MCFLLMDLFLKNNFIIFAISKEMTNQCKFFDKAECNGDTHNIGETGVLKKICVFHLLHNEGFLIQRSTIHAGGDGLFTINQYKKDAPVLEYVGEVLTKKQGEKLKKTDRDYLSHLTYGRVVDAKNKDKSSIARYANDARNSQYENNLFQNMAEKNDYTPKLKKNQLGLYFMLQKTSTEQRTILLNYSLIMGKNIGKKNLN